MGTSMEDALRAFAREAADSVVLAAVSGGPDSMALADGLHRCADEASIVLEVAHFNHRWRPDSTRDEDLVRAWCTARGIPFFSQSARRASGRQAVRPTESEATARQERYAFLHRVATTRSARWIVTAHTRDDQAETVVMRLERGCGLRGEAGIPARRGRIARPLLDVSRAATRTWCTAHHVPFRDDPSNHDLRYTRNRIRHVDLPRMCRNDPHAVDRLVARAKRAREQLDAIRARTDALLSTAFRREGTTWVADVARFAALSREETQVLIGDALDRFIAQGVEPSRMHYEALYRMTRTDCPVGEALSLPVLDVRREHDGLVFRPRPATDAPAVSVPLRVPGRTRFDRHVEIAAETLAADTIGAPSPGAWAREHTREVPRGECGGAPPAGVAYLDLDAIEPPLVARRPRPGDRVRPIGLGGSKKLSDLFADRHVPRRLRRQTVVIADRRGIVWVAGLATGESARVRDTTREILKLTVSTNSSPVR